MLANLDMMDEAAVDQNETGEDEGADQDQDLQEQEEGEADDLEGSGETLQMEKTDDASDDMEDGTMDASEAPTGEMLDEDGEGEDEDLRESRRPPTYGDVQRGPDYKAFTTKFDEMVLGRGALRSGRAGAPARLSRQAVAAHLRASSRVSPTACSAG